MCVFRNENRWDVSNVQFENGVIRRHSKKIRLPEMHHIDWGLGMLKASRLRLGHWVSLGIWSNFEKS
jgi:N-acetyl-alpha-D-muramate 1-phosphate uridylyltransferase